MLTLKDNVLATALDKMELDNVSIKMFDSAKFFATIVCKNFTLMGNDKTKTELNLNAEIIESYSSQGVKLLKLNPEKKLNSYKKKAIKTAIDLSKNAYLKALISSSSMTFDMYQKSVAIIEGDVIDSKLRLENNAVFTGKKFTTYTCALVTESYTTSTIIVEKSISIDASGKSETHLMGNPKIEIKNFADNAILAKK